MDSKELAMALFVEYDSTKFSEKSIIDYIIDLQKRINLQNSKIKFKFTLLRDVVVSVNDRKYNFLFEVINDEG